MIPESYYFIRQNFCLNRKCFSCTNIIVILAVRNESTCDIRDALPLVVTFNESVIHQKAIFKAAVTFQYDVWDVANIAFALPEWDM